MRYLRHTLVLAALVALAAAPSGGAQAPTTTGAVLADRDCLRGLKGLDLQRATIPELQAAMATGTITSTALVDAYMGRIAAYDSAGPKLNSVRALHPAARAQAEALDAERRAGRVRGPLHGIPVLLKDNVGTFDMPTTAGSIALEGAIPRRDATITAKFREAGAVILGKANLSEFAGWVALGMPPGYSSLAGQVKNAYDLAGTPSGSSSGSGVAASMAFAAATIGTETSGSILSPSDANGVVGVKTTHGLASRAGILPLSPEFDVPGPIVRSTVDAAVVLQTIAGADPERDPTTTGPPAPVDYLAGLSGDALRGARLAYSGTTREGLDEDRLALFDAAIDRLRKLGATVTEVGALAEEAGLAELPAIPNDFKWSLNAYLADELEGGHADSLSEVIAYNDQHPDRLPYGQNLLEASDATPGLQPLATAQAAPARAAAQGAIQAALAEGDAEAILTPGNAHASSGASAGYPTVMVPLGYTEGGRTPMGLGFLGTAFSEPRLLALAHAYERESRARVAPTEVNRQLKHVPCDPQASAPFVIDKLAVTARRKGRYLVISVRGAVANEIEVVVRRGQRLVADRRVKPRRGRARLRVRVRRNGTYRVTVLDTGPPLRTVRAKPGRVRR